MNKPSGNAETVYQTEAQWTADERVFGADVIAITTDGENAGKHKLFKGTGRWTTLNYVENGGGGAVTSDDVTDESTLGPGTLTAALDTLAQNFADNSTAITAVSANVTEMGGPYKVYRALLTQTGTAAPTAVILANTLGAVPVWTRNDVGSYTITLAAAFTVGKTWYNILTTRDDSSSIGFGVTHDGANAMSVFATIPATGLPADELLISTPFEILVYP